MILVSSSVDLIGVTSVNASKDHQKLNSYRGLASNLIPDYKRAASTVQVIAIMRALIVLALVGASLAIRVPKPSAEPHWREFRSTHLKSYRDASEELMRRFIFEDNLHQIQEFNRVNATKAGFTLGVNFYADMVSRVERNDS